MYVYVTDFIVAKSKKAKENEKDSKTTSSNKSTLIVYKDKEFTSILTSDNKKDIPADSYEIIRHVIGVGINEFNALLSKYGIIFEYKEDVLSNFECLKLVIKSKNSLEVTTGYDSLVMTIPDTNKLLIITPSLIKLIYSSLHEDLEYESVGEVIKSPYRVFLYTVELMSKITDEYMEDIDKLYSVIHKYQSTFRNMDKILQLSIKELKKTDIDKKFIDEIEHIYAIYGRMTNKIPLIKDLSIRLDLHGGNWKIKKDVKTGKDKVISIDPFVLFVDNIKMISEIYKDIYKTAKKKGII